MSEVGHNGMVPMTDAGDLLAECLECQPWTSAHFPKFVLHRSTHLHELRKVMGTSKSMIPSSAFDLKSPERILRRASEGLQIRRH